MHAVRCCGPGQAGCVGLTASVLVWSQKLVLGGAGAMPLHLVQPLSAMRSGKGEQQCGTVSTCRCTGRVQKSKL